MKFFKSLKAHFKMLLHNELATLIYSVVIACIAWFIISVTIYPTQPKSISGIPLKIDLTGSLAEANGLSIVSTDWEEISVDVTIQGNRSQIGGMTTDDLVAYAVIDNVTAAGEQQLSIQIKSVSDVAFTVQSISPKTVNVSFDKIESAEIPVQASIPNVTVAEGMTMGEITCNPTTISVTGASSALQLIDHVSLEVTEQRELDTSYTFATSTYTLYDANGAVIDSSAFTLDTVSYAVTVSVYTQKELPIDLNVVYAPSNFDMDFLKEHLVYSYDTIKIASQSKDSDISTLEQWSLGSIALNAIDEDFSKDFDIILQSGILNLSGIESVHASLDMEGLATKTVRVNDITFTNKPATHDFTMVTQYLNVTLIGDADALAAISETDIFATVDLTGNTTISSSFTADATITIPDYDTVWATGTYMVSAEAIEKSTTAEP